MQVTQDAALPGEAGALQPRLKTWFYAALALLLVARLALMALGPLADTTEARYGELARQTVVHGYWLMPHMDAQTPFFAKPPLSTWSSAVAMELLGVNEFAARLPALLFSSLAAWICYAWAGAHGVRQRWLVLPVLAATPIFFVSAGAVMTDAVQMLVVGGAQYFAWLAMQEKSRRARLAFWAFIGLGALAKGLATWALIGMPILAWAMLPGRRLAELWELWDWRGVLLALLLFVPWYAAAEHAYPGFLSYFIVGEHFSRFLVPGWTGDRYGFAHRQPWGAIWVFWLGGVLPWIVLFATRLTAVLRLRRATPLEAYLWCATLVPLLFFTFSRNIIGTYTLTAVPAFAVLAAGWLDRMEAAALRKAGMALAGFALLVLLAVPFILSRQEMSSERALLRAAAQAAPGAPLQYLAKPAFSSAFYGDTLIQPAAPGAPMPASGLVVVDNEKVAAIRGRVLFHGAHRTLLEVTP
ncbi:ArnT family glycosyltransferase [Massilia eburnea]|uniref:ArnT family glycosyltransferase n=1 Tax=Massilia eburnea TaxID=1776165 RepID=UPI00147823AA|nr:glycosyltransferase family 39 protein [Massilia eburnea]